jgi:DNA repair exonuclease SbcCD ATPase subunit
MPTHDLSMRDVMWLAFLPSKRLDNEALLHEGHDQKHYKLRQVIELLFDVHDDRLSQLLDQQKRLREERRAAEQEVTAVETFLAEEQVPRPESVHERRREIAGQREHVVAQLGDVSGRAAATTGYAQELRKRFARARALTARTAARVRDRQALYERLLPLRGQYAEDERKLVFSDEARRLFDPLSIDRCPACLSELAASPQIEGNRCSLCDQTLDEGGEPLFSVERERRSLRRRIRDLDAYTERVVEQIAEVERELAQHQEAEDRLGRELDDRTARDLSPFVAQREQLIQRRSALEAEDGQLARVVRWYDALERRKAQVAQLTGQLAAVREQLEQLRSNQPARDQVVRELSTRFASLLRSWGFPKVDDPEARSSTRSSFHTSAAGSTATLARMARRP